MGKIHSKTHLPFASSGRITGGILLFIFLFSPIFVAGFQTGNYRQSSESKRSIYPFRLKLGGGVKVYPQINRSGWIYYDLDNQTDYCQCYHNTDKLFSCGAPLPAVGCITHPKLVALNLTEKIVIADSFPSPSQARAKYNPTKYRCEYCAY